MKITALTAQQKDKDRVNIFVDGKYRFSLTIFQVSELSLRVGQEYTDEELTELETESVFGKLYMRALEYTMMRPHSAKEVQEYLYRKTRDTRLSTGAIKKGVAPAIAQRVFKKLSEKGYIDDEKFSRYWIENRHLKKGISFRKLTAELRSKGVDQSIVERLLVDSGRSDNEELKKIIAKKSSRYEDANKLIQYLMRQGFRYDDIKNALTELADD